MASTYCIYGDLFKKRPNFSYPLDGRQKRDGANQSALSSALEHLDMETEQAQQLIWLIHSLPELEDASQLSQFLAEPASL